MEFIGNSNEPMDFEESKDYYYKLQFSIINKIIKIMDESKEYYFIHESFIANQNQVICWNNIINLQNLIDIVNGEKGNTFLCHGDPEKIGTFWKYMKKEDKNFFIFFKVNNVTKSNKRNTWKYSLEAIGSVLRITSQEIQINVIKINENTSQISFFIKYKEKINKDTREEKKKKWNEAIKNIKNFINNIKK